MLFDFKTVLAQTISQTKQYKNMQNVTYTEPALCDYDGDLSKQWFVYFTIKNKETKEVIRKQVREEINYQTTAAARRKNAKTVIETWSEILREGYNPWATAQTTTNKLIGMSFKEALMFGLEKSKSSTARATYQVYRLAVNYILSIAQEFENMPIAKIEKLHVKLMLENAKEKYKWSNDSYNKNATRLRGVMGRLVHWEIIKFNPCSKLKLLPVVETKKYKPYTQKEKQKISEHLFINHYSFFVYLMVVYHTGMRLKEVLALQIKDVDLEENIITIYPDLEEENSKTKNIRIVTINNELLPFLRELNLEEYDKNFYVFGTSYLSDKKKKSINILHPDFLKPSPHRIYHRGIISKLWHKIVIKKLGINKYLYAAKHTGTDDKILAGVSLDALKKMYGHSSKFMTEKYASELQRIHFDEIRKLSPAFVPNKKAD